MNNFMIGLICVLDKKIADMKHLNTGNLCRSKIIEIIKILIIKHFVSGSHTYNFYF